MEQGVFFFWGGCNIEPEAVKWYSQPFSFFLGGWCRNKSWSEMSASAVCEGWKHSKTRRFGFEWISPIPPKWPKIGAKEKRPFAQKLQASGSLCDWIWWKINNMSPAIPALPNRFYHGEFTFQFHLAPFFWWGWWGKTIQRYLSI